jgi:hypothetical protein
MSASATGLFSHLPSERRRETFLEARPLASRGRVGKGGRAQGKRPTNLLGCVTVGEADSFCPQNRSSPLSSGQPPEMTLFMIKMQSFSMVPSKVDFHSGMATRDSPTLSAAGKWKCDSWNQYAYRKSVI